MDFNFKKMWPAAAASLVAITSVLSADSRMSDKDRDQDQIGTINPSVRPKNNGSQHWEIIGDVFLWQSHADGLEYAVADPGYTTSPANVIKDGTFIKPDFKWDFGFRVGAGYAFQHDGWGLDLKWTHFDNRAHGFDTDCCSEASGEALIAIASDIVTIPNSTSGDLLATSIKNHWKLHLNLVDLELGREFMTSKWLYIRPHMGLRGAWVKQKMTNNYVNVINTSTSQVAAFDTQTWENDFKGIGVRGGLDSQWNMGAGFSFYGNLAISIIYGRFEVEMDEFTSTTPVGGTITQVFHAEDNFHSSKAITDLALGLRYGHQFDDSNYNVAVSFGWEHHMFFNQNQLWQVTKVQNLDVFNKRSGDLATQGWTLGIMFDF